MNQNITVQECLERYARGETINICAGRVFLGQEKGAEPGRVSAPKVNQFTPLL